MENIYQSPKFFNNVVGGKKQLDTKQTQNQVKILKTIQRNKNEYKSEPSNKINLYDELSVKNSASEMDSSHIRKGNICGEKYNPLFDWNLKHGLLGKTNARFNEHYLHIDSSNRQKKSVMSISQNFNLSSNPFLTTELDDRIFISQSSHPFNVGDKITINGLTPQTNRLHVTSTSSPIIFTVGKDYMRLTLPNGHGISEKYATYEQINSLYVSIDGFSNTGSTGNNLYYGNIPLTFINKVHNFFLVDVERGLTFDENTIYVLLPYNYSIVPGIPTILSSFVDISLYYVNGIPSNLINAKFPTDIYHMNSYQVIDEITDNGYYIRVGMNALASGSVGGNSIVIGQVSDFAGGYTEPNKYSLQLEHILKNVVSVRMVSSEFPNSEYVIKNYPSSSTNNKIYWQNYEDGTYLYSVEIPTGKYDPTTLITAIQDAIYAVPRYLYPSVTQDYTNHNYIRITIDTATDTTTFSSYKEILMTRPFVNMYYIKNDSTADHIFTQVSTDIKDDPQANQLYPIFILIKFTNHGLTLNTSYQTHEENTDFIPDGSTGDEIIISGTTSYFGIPGTTIDGTYEVYAPNLGLNVSATDYFMIMLNPIDIGQYKNRDIAQSGGIFYMYIPNIFRLLFDKSDTMGQLLGFPNVGETFAVTKFDKTITNKDAYQPDICSITTVDTTTPGDAIILSGSNYILMVCDELNVVETLGTIKNAFAKILLVGIPGKVCFNTFVDTPKIFYEPIAELSKLTFTFYSPNGNLYDFNGLNHSFTLSLITLDNLPDDTNINTHTGNKL